MDSSPSSQTILLHCARDHHAVPGQRAHGYARLGPQNIQSGFCVRVEKRKADDRTGHDTVDGRLGEKSAKHLTGLRSLNLNSVSRRRNTTSTTLCFRVAFPL